MSESDIDPKVRSTYLLIFGVIIYLAVIAFFLLFLERWELGGVELIFALTLLPLLAIFIMVWGYGMKLKMPGLELEYYPVEKAMKPPSIIEEDKNAEEAEEKMRKEKTDFLNILDKEGIFRGILTKTDLHKARAEGKIREKIREIMTPREKVIHALEREDLKSIMQKIGESKHSRLPVLDKNNKILGIIDSVDINGLLSKILK